MLTFWCKKLVIVKIPYAVSALVMLFCTQTDMDLVCFDGQSLTGKYAKLVEMKLHEPAVTPGMKVSDVHSYMQ